MKTHISPNAQQMGQRAATAAAQIIRNAIQQQGQATIVVATGASQFHVLESLVLSADIDWSKVTGFHLDEYIGLPFSHNASFRKYLRERFVDLVPLRMFHYIDGEVRPPQAECDRLNSIIKMHTVDVAMVGIGENGHLAFNDPPANFETEVPYLVVVLDEACRRQQLSEGWFATLDDVPTQAISMSIHQILQSAAIICSVPDERKAQAVRDAIEGPISPNVPASALKQHARAELFLDEAAASLLTSHS